MEKVVKFKPSIAELQKLAKEYSQLKIKNENDKIGYAAVVAARKDLQQKRVAISKTGKELRAEAIAFQKKVIEIEKEAISLIEPVEKKLQEMQLVIDNKPYLEERKQQLKDIKVSLEDSVLLKMTNREFNRYYRQEREKYFLELERKEQERKEKEARKKAIEQAKKEAAEQAKREAEERARLEKERLIREKEEAERRAREREEEEKRLKEQEKRNKKFKDWLKKQNYDKKTDIIKKEENKIKLYRFIAEYPEN